MNFVPRQARIIHGTHNYTPPANIRSTGFQVLTLIPPLVYQINCPNVSASLSSYLLITTAFFYRKSNKALLGTYFLPNILWLWKRLHDRPTCIMHSDHHHQLSISQGQASHGIKLLEAPSCLHWLIAKRIILISMIGRGEKVTTTQ